MQIHDTNRDSEVLKFFREQQVLTLPELVTVLNCSSITAHRRLKEWNAFTSYNQNGQYHSLPTIPTFNSDGIWQWGEVLFSRYGTMKQTVVSLVRTSSEGMDHHQLEHILGVNPKYNLSQYTEIPGICKEQHHGRIIYFSDDPDVYIRQKRKRVPPLQSIKQLPNEARTILILVTCIQHPDMNIEQLVRYLNTQGIKISRDSITALFVHYGIGKKKRNMK